MNARASARWAQPKVPTRSPRRLGPGWISSVCVLVFISPHEHRCGANRICACAALKRLELEARAYLERTRSAGPEYLPGPAGGRAESRGVGQIEAVTSEVRVIEGIEDFAENLDRRGLAPQLEFL